MATRSSPYYLDTVVFQVEDELFKVPTYYFEKNSCIFRDMLSVPQPKNEPGEGTSDTNPLRLEGISKVDFSNLLEIMYPLDVPDGLRKSKDIWISALKLSKMWYFGQIRTLSISKLAYPSDISVVDKFLLASEYAIPDWLKSSLDTLIRRNEAPTTEECEKLGFHTSIRIFQLRERIFRSQLSTHLIPTEISAAFATEIRVVEKTNSEFRAAAGK